MYANNSHLGFVNEAVTLFKGAKSLSDTAKKSGGQSPIRPSGPGMPGAVNPTSPMTTTVSPTFQQQFNPQFSPVLQQSSGSGDQSASATQIAPGGQTAKGGSSVPSLGPSHSPYTPGYPRINPSNYRANDVAKLLPKVEKSFNYTPFIYGGVALIGILAAARYFNRRVV